MPRAPKKCGRPGCHERVPGGTSYCTEHRAEHQARAKTVGRGYGPDHRDERERLAPSVAAGNVDCAQPICLEELDGHGRRIRPGATWHLGHDQSRSTWIGPVHARCNVQDGATRSHAAR